MKYVKIETILPNNLVIEIQKYIQDEYIYIASQTIKRKEWGESSGSQTYYKNRNDDIRNKYAGGCKIKDLVEEFFLSIDSIKKIIYKKNE